MIFPRAGLLAAVFAALTTSTVSARTSEEPAFARPLPAAHGPSLWKKDAAALTADTTGAAVAQIPALLGTLAQTHTDERVLLDASTPGEPRFDELLADRVTGSSHAIDPRLLGLLRLVAARHTSPTLGPARIEIVSGYRSPKLNEMLRKKQHHVASHSQHSLGHAVDFRVVPAGETLALDPRVIEKEIRALGWDGGVGTYPTKDDWFVHADVGPNRRWVN